jgi:carboxymethylenebutenolidase
MSLHTEWIHYGKTGEYKGFLAKPGNAHGSLPAILVIQEIWGVEEHIQDVTRRFAQAGYVAFAPDLYVENGERAPQLSSERLEDLKNFLESVPPTAWRDNEERERHLAMLPAPRQQDLRETFGIVFGRVIAKLEEYVEPLKSASSFLRNEYNATKNQSIGSVGFCMGGALSAMLACHDPQLKAAVIFYGNAPRQELLTSIGCPIVGFYGELDQRITDAVPNFAKEMQEQDKSFEYHVYLGAHHAFFNDTRVSYHPGAARDAFARTLVFFNDHLSK